MLTITNILSEDDYKNIRRQTMQNVEEGGQVHLGGYADPKGIPTIGIGMNLRDASIRTAVLDKLLFPIIDLLSTVVQEAEKSYRVRIQQVVANTYSSDGAGAAALQADLDKVMRDRAADSVIPATNKQHATFTFMNLQEVIEVFNVIAISYEIQIDTILPNIPKSRERVALFSLVYNQQSENPLFAASTKLKAAIDSNNRPEAWFQIRYQSNKEKLPGVAKRRYLESEIFSLFSDPIHHIPLTEVDAALAMHTKYRKAVIEPYDRAFGMQVDQANHDYSGEAVQSTTATLAIARANRIEASGLTAVFTPTAVEVWVASSGYSTDLTGTDSDGLVVGNLLSETDITSYDLTGFGHKVIDDTNGRLVFGGQELKGTASASTTSSIYILRMSNSQNVFVLKKVNNDLRITINDFSNSPRSSLTLKNYFVGNLNGEITKFGLNLGNKIEVGNLSSSPALASLSNGKFVLAWIEQNNGNVLHGQLYNEDNSLSSELLTLYSSQYSSTPKLAAIANGGFALCWFDYFSGTSGAVIFVKLFNADGTQKSDKFVASLEGGNPAGFDIATLSTGGFAVVWDQGNGGVRGMFGRTFDRNGVVLNRLAFTTAAVGEKQIKSMAVLSNGKIVVVWGFGSLFGQVFNPDGTPSYTASGAAIAYDFNMQPTLDYSLFQVGTNASQFKIEPSIAALANGWFVVAWRADTGPNPDPIFGTPYPEAYSQVFNGNGRAISNDNLLSATTFSNRNWNSQVTTLHTGGYLATWDTQNPTNDIHASCGSYGGGGCFAIDVPVGGAAICGLMHGGYVIAWTENTYPTYRVRAKTFGNGYGNIIIPSTGATTITGSSSSDILIAPASGGTIVTGGGQDVIFVPPDAVNTLTTIVDFDPTLQRLDLTAIRISSMSAFTITAGSAVINLSNNQTIHLDDATGSITPDNITAANFIFAPPSLSPIVNCSGISQQMIVGTLWSADPKICISSPNGDSLIWGFTVNYIDALWLFQDPISGVISGIVPDLVSYNGTIYGSDLDGLTASVTFNIMGIAAPTVEPTGTPTAAAQPVNHPPHVAHEIPAQSVEVGSTFQLNVHDIFSDQDGDALALAAFKESGQVLPAWLQLSADKATLDGVPHVAENFNVSLTATDPHNASASTSFPIVVRNKISSDNSGFFSSITGANIAAGVGAAVLAGVAGFFACRRCRRPAELVVDGHPLANSSSGHEGSKIELTNTHGV